MVHARVAGKMPRFSNEEEAEFNTKYPQTPGAEFEYINEKIGDVSVILSRRNNQIDAICFLSLEEAMRHPTFEEFPEELKKSSLLRHFPRDDLP